MTVTELLEQAKSRSSEEREELVQGLIEMNTCTDEELDELLKGGYFHMIHVIL